MINVISLNQAITALSCRREQLQGEASEKAKEAEIAKVKNEANKKMFAMQVIQAVAQTATGAINAYSSAAAVPVVGYILAPIAAAAAVAAGMLQVAAIKKQQQASEATGYSSGGFTPDGRVDEAVGVVHACIRNRFNVQLWKDLHTIRNITRRNDITILEWMDAHGIEDDERNWNTIAKILQRKRAVYCVGKRLTNHKSSQHKKKKAKNTPTSEDNCPLENQEQ